jgi:hypothetical protein
LEGFNLLVDGVAQVFNGHLYLVEGEIEDIFAFIARPALEVLQVGVIQALLCSIARLRVVHQHVVQQVEGLYACLNQ